MVTISVRCGVLPDVRCGPAGLLPSLERRARRRPDFLTGLCVERREERLAFRVEQLIHAPVVHERRGRGAEVEIHRLRRPRLLPQQLPVERVTEQPDVAAKRRIQPLAIGGRRFRCVGVLAMPAARRLALMRFLLPQHLAGGRLYRHHHVADRLHLVRQLDVARDDPLVHLRGGQTLFREFGGEVVAKDARGGLLEAPGIDCRGQIHAIAPDDGRRPAAAGNIGHPGDILLRGPFHRAASTHPPRRCRSRPETAASPWDRLTAPPPRPPPKATSEMAMLFIRCECWTAEPMTHVAGRCAALVAPMSRDGISPVVAFPHLRDVRRMVPAVPRIQSRSSSSVIGPFSGCMMVLANADESSDFRNVTHR